MNADSVKVYKALPLTGVFSEVHRVYSTRKLRISMGHIVNTSGAAVTVSICFVKPGDPVSVANSILWNYSIPGEDFIEFGEGFWLPPNYQIMAAASSDNVVNVVFSGEEE